MGEFELYRKWRPEKWADLNGQESIVNTIKRWLVKKSFPHALLLTGPSGVGKTTVARLLRPWLKCGEDDYVEINCASLESPIDTVRSIQSDMQLKPMWGASRIVYLDEVGSLKRSHFGQEAMLKILEDSPPHMYFMLSTTDPDKLIKPIRTRCNTLTFKLLKPADLEQVIARVLVCEKASLSIPVLNRLIELAEGSARQALSDLHRIIGLKTEEEQLEALQSDTSRGKAIQIAQLLIKANPKWDEVATVLKDLEEDPEAIRRLVLSYANSCLLKGMARAANLISAFRDHFYDCGKPGLTLACWEVINRR